MSEKKIIKVRGSQIGGPVVSGDMNITNIIMFKDSEREFVVTRNANIRPVAYFTGRETELRELRQRIESGRKSVLVSGMGGIGKTHICRKLFEEYLNKHAGNGNGPFYHIGYIEYNGDMGSSLQRCLKYREQENKEANQEAAWRELEYLASDGKLLLFVDNVDKPMADDPGLQRLKSIPGAVVLTSRQISFSDEFEPYRIGFLKIEQCRKIYERIRYEDSGGTVKQEEILDLEYIIEKLAGRHTITVELLAHMARIKLWTVKKLREELDEKGFRLEFHKNRELVNIQKAYEALYDLSKLTKAEQNILEAFSVFPYIPLSAEVCNQWLLEDAGVSKEDDILIGLYQKGWLQFDIKQESYALHPVFAQFIYGKYKPKEKNHFGLIEGCQECLSVPDNGLVIECRKFIPFAEGIADRLIVKDFSLVLELIHLLLYIADYNKVEKLCENFLRIPKKGFRKRNPAMTFIYNNLAEVYMIQGKHREAEELYKKSLRIQEKVFGEEHLCTAATYTYLADLYCGRKKYREAEELYKKSLRIQEKLRKGHSSTATSYSNLVGIYAYQGKYREAEELYKKSLRIQEKLREGHPDTAAFYNNLACMYLEQGKYGEAEKLFKGSLLIWKKVFGEENPKTASIYRNLAIVYSTQGEYEKAIYYLSKAYKVSLGIMIVDNVESILDLMFIYHKWKPKGDFLRWFEENLNE